MKRLNRFTTLALVLGSLVAFSSAGCKKKVAAPKTPEEGMLQVQAALVKASPEVQSKFNNVVVMGIRYGKNAEALAALEQIGDDPSLTPEQKKVVKEEIDLLRAKTPSP
jgi:hypothetical protein